MENFLLFMDSSENYKCAQEYVICNNNNNRLLYKPVTNCATLYYFCYMKYANDMKKSDNVLKEKDASS